MFWWCWWWEAYLGCLAAMGGSAGAPLGGARRDLEREEYLVRELREDLELQGIQGIIDEGGRR